MLIERSEVLGAEPYERSAERTGHANGFKPKTVRSRLGRLELRIPQTRGVAFHPSALERGERSERALKLAVAETYVQGVSTRTVAAALRRVLNAADRREAEERLARLVAEQQRTAPQLTAWLEAHVPPGFAVFAVPEPHRRRMRTTNGLERLHKEIKRRTRVATLFPNEASLLRLVTAVLVEVSEEWETGKTYLTLTAPHPTLEKELA